MKSSKYEIKIIKDNHLIINSTRDNYKLHYSGHVKYPISGMHFHFSVRKNGIHRYDISGRNLKSENSRYGGYHSSLEDISNEPDLFAQYIEVAAGLGEFIPKLTENKRLRNKPIVIDPGNYELMREMLNYFQRTFPRNKHLHEIDILINRCDRILDKSKVTLINKKLKDAASIHHNLRDYCDVLVDNYGPYFWQNMHENLNHRKVEAIELGFLKNGGKLYREKGFFQHFKNENLFEKIWRSDI